MMPRFGSNDPWRALWQIVVGDYTLGLLLLALALALIMALTSALAKAIVVVLALLLALSLSISDPLSRSSSLARWYFFNTLS